MLIRTGSCRTTTTRLILHYEDFWHSPQFTIDTLERYFKCQIDESARSQMKYKIFNVSLIYSFTKDSGFEKFGPTLNLTQSWAIHLHGQHISSTGGATHIQDLGKIQRDVLLQD